MESLPVCFVLCSLLNAGAGVVCVPCMMRSMDSGGDQLSFLCIDAIFLLLLFAPSIRHGPDKFSVLHIT